MKLWDHQIPADEYVKRNERIALFMEMRLGKCLITIRWAKHHGLKYVLLIAPWNTIRGKLQWEGELASQSVPHLTLPLLKKTQWRSALSLWNIRNGRLQEMPRPGWVLINYEALLYYPQLLNRHWDGIVIDESTRIRNPKAKLTKLLHTSTSHIEHRAILSGLPNPEDPGDYFSQFKFLDGEFMGYTNFWQWRHDHFHEGWAQYIWLPNPGTREAIRREVHRRAFVLLRKTAKVGSEKIREKIILPMNDLQRTAMRTMKKEYQLLDRETKWATVVHLWQQKLAGGFHPITNELISDAKVKALLDICCAKKPVVVWFRFNHEIEYAAQYLQQNARSLRVAYVHGAMKNSKELRTVYQERFQDGKLDVILLQIKLGRFGWNLSRANTTIYYSNTYEFEDRSQSEDRIIHVKKTNPVTYIDLVTEHSTDEDIVEAVSKKRMTSRMFARQVKRAALRRLAA